MSDSHRSKKPQHRPITAAKGPPRIVMLHPAHGDFHPLGRSALKAALMGPLRIPSIGLQTIELRARNHPIGEPYAFYDPMDRRIVLYSVPHVRWEVLQEKDHHECGGIGVKGPAVEWANDEQIADYMWRVLWHELGHHYQRMQRGRRGKWKRRSESEELADLTARKLATKSAK